MVLGLIIICAVFYAIDPTFLSSYNLVSMTQFAAPVGIISLGIVLVLLLGEIDLSVGSVSGFSAACMAVLIVNKGWDPTLGLVAGILVGTAIGLLYAVLYTRVGVPSFVFSLAGLLAFQGGLLYVLGDTGTIRLPAESWLVQFARFKFVPDTVAYVLVLLIVAAYLGSQLYGRARRSAAGLVQRLAADRVHQGRRHARSGWRTSPTTSASTVAGATSGCCSRRWWWSWTCCCARRRGAGTCSPSAATRRRPGAPASRSG